ncbi:MULTISPECIES: hypothetical protein [Actinoalloteichus]|uniref:Uncharacterized protein n=1 Tax=Actinoalloteichus fjordicus TaxID=1612552 RepID=A0AAC9L7W5_9PSEU|nr:MULTISPECIES: hypothetical protein [Actinoalloteichus]APU12732.1 hypothetical protein UA74_03250 [Actinoalloteichus fjordicus]APU18702.1 hypothetical protein UA75_03340 [Actinoalloteichus sp. GBA129-24]
METPQNGKAAPTPDRAAYSARRMQEVFGDVLPATTADERDERDGRPGHGDDWYRDNRPPHHG